MCLLISAKIIFGTYEGKQDLQHHLRKLYDNPILNSYAGGTAKACWGSAEDPGSSRKACPSLPVPVRGLCPPEQIGAL